MVDWGTSGTSDGYSPEELDNLTKVVRASTSQLARPPFHDAALVHSVMQFLTRGDRHSAVGKCNWVRVSGVPLLPLFCICMLWQP